MQIDLEVAVSNIGEEGSQLYASYPDIQGEALRGQEAPRPFQEKKSNSKSSTDEIKPQRHDHLKVHAWSFGFSQNTVAAI